MIIEYFTLWLENSGTILQSVEFIQSEAIASSKENAIKAATRKIVIPDKFKRDISGMSG